MGERSSVGRRRAPDQRTVTDDAPASHAVMATVWRSLSQVQAVLGHRLLDLAPTAADQHLADRRLADQLSLLPTVHDWQPVTRSEAADLLYLLDLYLEPTADATRDSVARALHVAIRAMAVGRSTAAAAAASITPGRDQSPEISQMRT